MAQGIINYDAVTTNEILDTANKFRQQTTSEEAETVQVYDTNGNPHKIAKEELLKKSALALPSIDNISKFVAINEDGNSVGVMTKEQVVSVIAELIPFPFTSRPYINDANKDVDSGYYRGTSSNINTPISYGILVVFSTYENYTAQLFFDISDTRMWLRGSINKGDTWTEWKEFS